MMKAFSGPSHRGRRQVKENFWGYSFSLTPEHLTAGQISPLRFSCDHIGDEVLKRLDGPSDPALPSGNHRDGNERQKQSDGHRSSEFKDRDAYARLEKRAQSDPVLTRFWQDIHTVPPFVDWAQIERGQAVFYRYGGAALTGLAFQSLLGGMGAWRVVETLAKTGGFSANAARRRLYETTQHILQVTRSLQSIQPGGDGFKSSIRVRLLHAAVRYRILDLANRDPDYYSVSKLGVPISDIDCVATISTFSSSLVWIALPRQGIFLRSQEVVDYLALFRYIAYLTGTPDHYFSTPSSARAMMESLLMHEIDPSPLSRTLASNVIQGLANQPPQYASPEFLVTAARWLNGHDLCDALGLERPGLYYWVLMAGQCLLYVAPGPMHQPRGPAFRVIQPFYWDDRV